MKTIGLTLYLSYSDFRIALPATADAIVARQPYRPVFAVVTIVGTQKLYYIFGKRIKDTLRK